MFPLFHVQKAGTTTHAIVGAITESISGNKASVADGRIGFLRRGETVICGEWRKRDERWEFAPENHDSVPIIAAASTWEVLDAYWGERAAIVLDKTRQWLKAHFEPVDAIRCKQNAGRELTSDVLKDGWDHEHCAICWEKIGVNGQPEGYISDRTWVCECCYTDFVINCSLQFIPTA